MRITSDGRGLSQFTAKAWVIFNGTGTPGVIDGHNVASITDLGVGQYQVNYSNNVASSNYCAITDTSGASYAFSSRPNDREVGQVDVDVSNGTNSYIDAGRVYLLVFSD